MTCSHIVRSIGVGAFLAGLGSTLVHAQRSPRPASASPADESTGISGTAAPGKAVVIAGAEQFDLRSRSGLDYRIFVAAPTGAIPPTGSPVVYLSDGNSNFPILQAAARRQTRDGVGAVVVGVGYPSDDPAVQVRRRAVDLVPAAANPAANTTPPTSGSGSGSGSVASGGDDRFLDFLEHELKPVIETKYKIDRNRQTLFGHSFGGLFVLHVLFRKPDSFQTYLASSPSLWWNDGGIRAEAEGFLKKHTEKTLNARLFISVGEWEQKSRPEASAERRELLEKRRMVGSVQELATRLTTAGVPGLTTTFREFAEEDHGTVVLPAASRGVRFALDDRP